MIRRVAQRWSADKPLAVLSRQLVTGQKQILGAGLAIGSLPFPPGSGDTIQRFGAGDMHYEKGGSGLACQFQCPAYRLSLQRGRPGAGVPDRGSVAGRQRFGAQPVNHRPVLTVQDRQRTVACQCSQDLVEPGIVQTEWAVSLIHLERIDTGRHHIGNTVQPVISMPDRDVHVQSIIDHHPAVSLDPAGSQRVQHRLLGLRMNKVDHGGSPAASGRHRAAPKIVAAHVLGHRRLQVDMCIHPAGDEIAPARVHHAFPLQAHAHRGDTFAIDSDIGREAGGARDDLCVGDD